MKSSHFPRIAFTENYIVQELITQDRKLYYWTSTGTAEVDFLIEDGRIANLPLYLIHQLPNLIKG